jgi:hypothetical protein
MKTLTTLFALALFCATACGQTIKALGYNTTNGEVVYAGTNVLTFTNGLQVFDGEIKAIELTYDAASEFVYGIAIASQIEFFGTNATTAAATTRTNLGIPLPALTNTSNADMLSALGAVQTIFTVKTNDQTIIDETNATTITDLTFATEPGARYVVTFVPIVEDGAFIQIIASNALVFGNWNQVGIAFASTNPITNEATIGTSGTIRSPVQVFYVEGGTNAGAISATFRGATNTTNTIKAGSFLRADKMP